MKYHYLTIQQAKPSTVTNAKCLRSNDIPMVIFIHVIM